MANNNQTKVNIVYADTSTVFDKKQLLASLGYFDRTRWERKSCIDVLRSDDGYLKLMSSEKQYCDFVKGTSPFGHTIETSIYTDTKNNQLLFATVANRKDNNLTQSQNQQYINSTKERENFVFASVIPNKTVTQETREKGKQVMVVEGVQLFRYDPTGNFNHINSQEIYDYYLNNYGQSVADIYRKIFSKESGFPHFHFMNRTMSETYGKTAESDAITLDNLIKYIEKLRSVNDVNHVLNNFDFAMPYLGIKKNPNKYKTAIDVQNLKKALCNNTVNKQLDSIFKQTQKLQPSMVVLTGLDAVYADLILLRILRGGSGMALPQSGSNGQPPTPGFMPGQGGNGSMSGGGSGNGFSKGAGSGFSMFIELNKRNKFRNEFHEEYGDGPQYDVSMAELQLATKLATTQNMILRNSNGRTKMHFEEAKSQVDQNSYLLLFNLLDICEFKKYKGDKDEPTL